MNAIRTIVKKKTIILFLSVLTILSACQDSIKSSIETNTLTKADYTKIGELHTQGLEYTFEYLKANQVRGMKANDLLKLNQKSSEEFFNLTYSKFSETDRKAIIKKVTELNEALVNAMLPQKNGRVQDAVQDLVSQLSPYVSSAQRTQINDVFYTVATYDNNLGYVQSTLDNIESQAYSLPSNESPVVLTAVAVARSSTSYWEDNLDAWYDAIYPPPTCEGCPPNVNNRTQGRIAWGTVATMDVVAATIIGIGYSPAVIVPFVGWGFWAASTVGAAVIVSGATAIISYIYSTSSSSYNPGRLEIPPRID